MTRFLRPVADLLMPRVCLCCGCKLGPQEEHLCTSCLSDIPLTRYWKLRENPMSEKFNALIQQTMGDNAGYQPYSYAASLFFYRDSYKPVTRALKYHRNFSAGKFFASMLGRQLRDAALFADVDLVIPVPLHWTRRLHRGYNQAEIIAKELAKEMGAACRTDLLRRTRRTRTQTRLDSAERAKNVGGAFRCTGKCACAGHILLVDDVFTTGSTAVACEKALRDRLGGKVRISVATLACVEK